MVFAEHPGDSEEGIVGVFFGGVKIQEGSIGVYCFAMVTGVLEFFGDGEDGRVNEATTYGDGVGVAGSDADEVEFLFELFEFGLSGWAKETVGLEIVLLLEVDDVCVAKSLESEANLLTSIWEFGGVARGVVDVGVNGGDGGVEFVFIDVGNSEEGFGGMGVLGMLKGKIAIDRGGRFPFVEVFEE